MNRLLVLFWGVFATFSLVGYVLVRDSRHEHAVRTEEGFLRKRLCTMQNHRERAQFCTRYERTMEKASVGCYDSIDENGRPVIRTYVYWDDYEPGPDRPLDCK